MILEVDMGSARETPESCNHWWHRNLLDPRVEADLLADPNFYATCRATDRKFEKKEQT